MSAPSDRTKAQLIEEVGALKAKVAEWHKWSEKQEAATKQASPEPVREADAIAGCIRALDTLGGMERPAYSSSAGAWRPDYGAVERVLQLLASRYNVPLIQIETRDCERKHVDEIQPYQLTNLLQGLS